MADAWLDMADRASQGGTEYTQRYSVAVPKLNNSKLKTQGGA
jgi:hypothetical protein